MAKLFPAELPTSTKSGGEISIFNKIKKCGQDFDWSIMHSYKVKNHVFKKWGEIDFLFILPNKGIVCLEVKDHKEIVFENRQWFFGRAKKKGENPFDQIKDNTESLLKEIRNLRQFFRSDIRCYRSLLPRLQKTKCPMILVFSFFR